MPLPRLLFDRAHGLLRLGAVLGLVGLLLAGRPPSAHAAEEAARLQPSGMPARLWLDDRGGRLDFQDYLRVAKEQISKHLWALPGETPQSRRDRVDKVAPRQWPLAAGCDEKNTEGVLLIHGLTDSPYLMRDLGDAFQGMAKPCLLIRSILLPGHAGTPGDLTVVGYESWIEAMQYGAASFAGKARSLHIVGFSTGGALGLHAAYAGVAGAPPLRSLMLFSPAVWPAGRLTRIPLLPHLAMWASRTTGRMTWTDVYDDLDAVKYESFALNAGYQIVLLDGSLRRYRKQKIGVPMFVALSRGDATVDAEDAIELFKVSDDPRSRLLLVARSADDAVVREATKDTRRVAFYPAALPSESVVDFAHTSMVTSPADPHYGKSGDYVNCLEYFRTTDKYCTCNGGIVKSPRCDGVQQLSAAALPIVYGERGGRDDKVIVRRMTFNPYYDEMMRELKKFFLSVAE